MSRRRLYPPYGWPTSQRHERHQAAEESSWTTSEINSKRCQIGESTGESTERVRSLQRTGLALGRGGLNFGTAENNCKTKPARARLWHSTVGGGGPIPRNRRPPLAKSTEKRPSSSRGGSAVGSFDPPSSDATSARSYHGPVTSKNPFFFSARFAVQLYAV